MPVKKDENGHRYVEAEVEVPGTPEAVWQAIATGPGISAWFVPTTVEERAGGSAVSNFGPGMESVAKITAWDPPRRFDAETQEAAGRVATEWHVEARSGDTCVVRVVHRWFADTDDWDAQFEGFEAGWREFFRMLRIYLGHFAGERATPVALSAFSTQPIDATWRAVTGGFELGGERATSAAGAPALRGAVEMQSAEHGQLLLRLEHPAPGLAHFFAMPMGPQVLVSARFYLYGERGAAAAPAVEREWSAWLGERFPQAAS